MDINPSCDQEKWAKFEQKNIFDLSDHAKELIASYRKTLKLLELDLPNQSYAWLNKCETASYVQVLFK